MIVWHVLAILAVQALSSGRAAILGYTMPIFSALWGVAVFGERLRPRHVAGIVAAGASASRCCSGTSSRTLAGKPLAAVGMLLAAAVWAARHAADAAHDDRRADARDRLLDDAARRPWSMTTRDGALRARPLGAARRRRRWPRSPTTRVLIFGFAQPVWLILRAQPAADRLEHVGDADPGARHRRRRVVAARVAALAGRRGDRARPARDRLGDVAGARPRTPRRRPRSATSRARSGRVRVGEAEAGQDLALARFHRLGVGRALVVEALRVQRAVDDQVRVVGGRARCPARPPRARPPARTAPGRRRSARRAAS